MDHLGEPVGRPGIPFRYTPADFATRVRHRGLESKKTNHIVNLGDGVRSMALNLTFLDGESDDRIDAIYWISGTFSCCLLRDARSLTIRLGGI